MLKDYWKSNRDCGCGSDINCSYVNALRIEQKGLFDQQQKQKSGEEKLKSLVPALLID